MRFEKCLKLHKTKITFWYQLLISLRYKIENYFVLNGCFSNLALAKLVAVCVKKAGKLLRCWLSVHHVRHHTGAVRGHGLDCWGLEDRRAGVTIRTLLLVTELVVVGAEPSTAKPTRVWFLTCTKKTQWTRETLLIKRQISYRYVSSCAYSRWIYHIEFSHK